MSVSERIQEVELRALLPTLRPIKEKLSTLGAQFKGTRKIHDVYFCPKEATSFADVEMNEVGSYSLRLRQEEDGNDRRSFLNGKTITTKGDHYAWEEHDVTVGDFTEARRLLEATKFKAFCEIVKTRDEFALSDVSVNLENIENFGGVIEVEKMVARGQEPAAKRELMEVLSSLGIDESCLVKKSVTNIIMHQRAAFG